MIGPTQQDRMRFLRKCFQFGDMNNKGYLTLQDLKCAYTAALGSRPSKFMLAQLFPQQIQGREKHEIQVTWEGFTNVMLERVMKADLLEDIRRMFKSFDLRSEGFISIKTFRQACADVFPHILSETLYAIFEEADRNADGRVTYHDFESIILESIHLQNEQTLRRSTKRQSLLPQVRSLPNHK